jgi:Skp family chaperone for outer membrane proteins
MKKNNIIEQGIYSVSKFLVITIVCMLSVIKVQAQVATVDSKKIMATMPVFAKIDTLVQEEYEKYTAQYNQKLELAKKLTQKSDSISKQTNPAATASSIEEALAEAKKAQDDFRAFEKKVQQKVTEYKSFILNPYYSKINAAVKEVAMRLKYKQVMDIQAVNFAYIDPLADITDLVIKAMK